jgi:hypothetical protein
MKPNVLRALRWIMPSLGVVIATVILCSAQLHLDAAKAKKQRAEAALAAAEEAREQIISMGDRNRFATEPVSPTEEAKFLDGLKRHVAASGAAIIKWTSSMETYLPPAEGDASASTASTTDPVLAGLTRVTSELTLAGQYSQLRSFLHGISKSPRLYTLSEIRWNRERNECQLSLNLSRYLAPQAEEQSAMTVASAHTGSTEILK